MGEFYNVSIDHISNVGFHPCILTFVIRLVTTQSSNDNRAIGGSTELPEMLRNARTENIFCTVGPPRDSF